MQLIINKTRSGVTWSTPIEEAIKLLANGEYTVTLRRVRHGQSERQRNLLRLWQACIADNEGIKPNEVHDYYCMRFLSYHTDFCGGAQVCHGTSGLTRAQMSEFMDNVQRHAREVLGIALPDPHDESNVLKDIYGS